MRKMFRALIEFFRDLPGEDGASDYQQDDPCDPQIATRRETTILHDDEFIFLRRPKP